MVGVGRRGDGSTAAATAGTAGGASRGAAAAVEEARHPSGGIEIHGSHRRTVIHAVVVVTTIVTVTVIVFVEPPAKGTGTAACQRVVVEGAGASAPLALPHCAVQ